MATAAPGPLDRISLRDHTVEVEIGAFQAERGSTQRISFNVVVEIAPLPKDLEDVLLDCLAKKPADRPRNARDLLARLEACAEVGAWSEEDALAWWDGHVVRRSTPEVAERSRAPTMMTMTLDRKR